jgi:predicted metalloprotease with PDZ domain
MRALWRRFGRSGNTTPGMVTTTYTIPELESTLGEITGDAAFAKEFFERYVNGRELVDYAKLFARAGMVMRKRHAGTPWLGEAQLQVGAGGARVDSLVPFGSPLYKAGVAEDDHIVSLGGTTLVQPAQIEEVLGRHKPGDAIPIAFVRRGGEKVEGVITLDEDPRVEIVTVESTGGTLSPEQKRFRDAWLNAQ